MAFEEEEKMFLVALVDAYEKAARKNDARVIVNFMEERKKIEAIYEKFCKELNRQFDKDNLKPNEYLKLFEILTKKAMGAFATGNAKELEGFEKELSKRIDFALVNTTSSS